MKTMHLVKEEFRGADVIRNAGYAAAYVVGHGALFATVSAVCLASYVIVPWGSGWYQTAFAEWFEYEIGFVALSALIAFCAATAADAGIRWFWREDSLIPLHRTVVLSVLGMLFVMAGVQHEFRLGIIPTEPTLAWQVVMPLLYGVAAALVVSAKMQLRHVGAWLRRAA
jgi:hypothetical protein